MALGIALATASIAMAQDSLVEGSFKGDTPRVRATKKGGPTGECGSGFVGTVEADKILAKWGSYDAEFRK